MSIDFARITEISDERGNITRITDETGTVLWRSGRPAVLRVQKVTKEPAEGETTYPAESFILLDIYLKPNRSASITYGGVTKVVTDTSGAENPNATQVFFGAYKGQADSVETPDSGILTIEGGYNSFGCGVISTGVKGISEACSCIQEVLDFGQAEYIAPAAFYGCDALASISIPSGITSIGDFAFYGCDGLTSITIPDSVQSIGGYTFAACIHLADIRLSDRIKEIPARCFSECSALTSIALPSALKTIGTHAFFNCSALTRITLPEGLERLEDYAFNGCSNLDHVVVPASVTFLGTLSLAAYENSSGFYQGDYYMRGTNPPEMLYEYVNSNGETKYHTGAFGARLSIWSLHIWVPRGYADVYKAVPWWNQYASYIYEEE